MYDSLCKLQYVYRNARLLILCVILQMHFYLSGLKINNKSFWRAEAQGMVSCALSATALNHNIVHDNGERE